MRTVLAAAFAAVALAVPQAGAAPAPAPQVTDIAGDANGLNAQGFEDTATQVPDGGTSTDPASYAAADIRAVTFTKTVTTTVVRKKKVTKVTGYTVKLELGAPPASGITYRIEGTTPLCTSFFHEYRVDYTGAAKSGLRCASTDAAATYDIAPAVVSGSTITWTVPLAKLTGYKVGTLFDNLGAQTRGFVWFAGQTVPVPVLGNTTGLTVPQIDHAVGTTPFKLG